MKIIRQQATLLEHSRNDPYGFIEDVARVCYKSEAKKTSESALKMVKNLIKSSHLAMLEHEYVYFRLSPNAYTSLIDDITPGDLRYISFDIPYMSASFRALLELYTATKQYLDFNLDVVGELFYKVWETYPEIFPKVKKPKLEYGVKIINREEVLSQYTDFTGLPRPIICEYAESSTLPSSILPHTIKFTTNRGVANELTRHRPASFAQESTRYVAYDQDKHGGQIEVIEPLIDPSDIENYNAWHYAMIMAETQYMNLRKNGIAAQTARGVLPLDLKTELVVTATEQEWQHIINLRMHGTTGAPHPQIKQLMELAYPILQKESGGRIK